MSTFVILLRGVMPTGRNKVPMAALRAALEASGLEAVRTWIQSGNVVARSSLRQSAVEQLVHQVIADEFGGDIAVIARTPVRFRRIVAENPFAGADTARLYYTLLSSRPCSQDVEAFMATDFAPDRVAVVGDVVYLLCATRYSDAKPNNNYVERKLQVTATTRNHNTMSKLVELSAKNTHNDEEG